MKKEQYIDSDNQILKVEIDFFGSKYYYKSKGQYHRLDGPAVEYTNGSYVWYKEGKFHRIGGPAYFSIFDNYYEWCINDKEVGVYYIYG